MANPAAAPPPPPGPQEWSPYTAPAPVPPPVRSDASPGLAFVLGILPGVGAIYNAQYVKAFLHVIVLGVLITILNHDGGNTFQPLFVVLLLAWLVYMPFEAYHTERRRQFGEPVDEFSSLLPMRRRGFPMRPIVLIAFGVLFLLINFDLVTFDRMVRYWPIALILLGAYMLYERLAASRENANDGGAFNTPFGGSPGGVEAQHERR